MECLTCRGTGLFQPKSGPPCPCPDCRTTGRQTPEQGSEPRKPTPKKPDERSAIIAPRHYRLGRRAFVAALFSRPARGLAPSRCRRPSAGIVAAASSIADAVQAGLVDRRSDEGALVLLTGRGQRSPRARLRNKELRRLPVCKLRAVLRSHDRRAAGNSRTEGTMTEANLARVLLAHLQRRPNATPAEALAAFRRRLAELRIKPKG